MTIYFVAGEVSADNHGAALMRSLRVLDPELKFIGRGGPQMQQVAGAQFKNWIGDAAVLGLWEVLRKYGYFREQFRQTLKEIQESKPDAVVLIDYPGFNLRLARALRRQSQDQKIIYYISPQVWAWNRGRIKRMARFIDLVLCIFPFEADLYTASGLRAVFVGHPMIERLEAAEDRYSPRSKSNRTFSGQSFARSAKNLSSDDRSRAPTVATQPDFALSSRSRIRRTRTRDG